jgi:flagellar FliL protein
MAAVDTDIDGEAEGPELEGEDLEAPKKRFSGKFLTLFVFLPLLLLGGGGAGLYFSGLVDSLVASVEEMAGLTEEEAAGVAVFYDLPELLVNLNGGGKKGAFLRLKVALELDDPEAITSLEQVLPRVIDNFQVYLRELRVEDLRGSAGLFRLKEELLVRVNAAVKPLHVKDVLFKEMIIQ